MQEYSLTEQLFHWSHELHQWTYGKYALLHVSQYRDCSHCVQLNTHSLLTPGIGASHNSIINNIQTILTKTMWYTHVFRYTAPIKYTCSIYCIIHDQRHKRQMQVSVVGALINMFNLNLVGTHTHTHAINMHMPGLVITISLVTLSPRVSVPFTVS